MLNRPEPTIERCYPPDMLYAGMALGLSLIAIRWAFIILRAHIETVRETAQSAIMLAAAAKRDAAQALARADE